ncbi:MAG: hypothetical protein V1494_04895 [Candidatus Diapherotrites archaeon]
MAEGNGAVSLKAAKIEKELYRAKNLIDSFNELNSSLSAIFLEIEALKDETRSTSGAEEFKRALKEKNLLKLYSDFSEKLKALKSEVNAAEEKSASFAPFIESFRTTQLFEFVSEKKALEFIEQLFTVFDSEEVLYKPEYIGAFSLQNFEKDLEGAKRKGKEFISIPTEKIPQLVEFLRQNKLANNFFLSNPFVKLQWKHLKYVLVESEPAKIKRAERLFKEMQEPSEAQKTIAETIV